ncbi:hypothetical protein ACKI2C_36065 [Streptomyces brasiliscabiei]|uniref:hypothetical protein n=1 Tax=Streptomyces brasiliscabiei TaxID=2736302 RepID=UPI0038F66697
MAPWLASWIKPYTRMQEASIRTGKSGSEDCHVDARSLAHDEAVARREALHLGH